MNLNRLVTQYLMKLAKYLDINEYNNIQLHELSEHIGKGGEFPILWEVEPRVKVRWFCLNENGRFERTDD